MPIVNIDQLKKVNEQLEGVTDLLDSYCEEIQKQIDAAPQAAQQILNQKCEELSANISVRVKPIRNKLVDFLHKQYIAITAKIQPILSLLNISLSLDTVVSVVESIIQIIIAPYQPYIELLSQLPPELEKLNTNLQKIATYQPKLNLPQGVTPPPISADVGTITMQDVINGVQK